MLQELRATRPAIALPRDFYRDEGFLQLELDHLFHKDWIFAGHDCEIPKAGDYFTIELGQYPLIVARDDDGKIHAHPQHLPPSRLPRLRRAARLGEAVRLPLSPVDLRARRPAAVRTEAMGGEFRQRPSTA